MAYYTDHEIELAYLKLYGKRPSYLELQQFRPYYRRPSIHISTEDLEKMAERFPSKAWKKEEPKPEPKPEEDTTDFLIE